MRKILAILLVLIMMISAIPLTLVHAAEVTAPTAFPNTTDEWVLTPITDGTFTASNTTKWATSFDGATQSLFDNENVVDLTKVTGMIFKADSVSSYLQWYFNIRFSDGTAEQKLKADSKPFYWYDANGWGAGKTAGTSWTAPDVKSGYAYFDFSDLTLNSTNIANWGIYHTSNKRTGTYGEWCFVQTKEQAENYPLVPEKEAIAAPTTFPETTTTMLYKQITDGTLTQAGTAHVFKNTKSMTEADNGKTYTIFDNGSVDFANYSGIMTKVKQTSTGRLYMRWYVKFDGQTSNQYINAKGRTLMVWDGTTWTECTSGATDSNWQLPNLGEGGEAYVYLSFDDVKDVEFAQYGTVVTDLTIHSSKGTNRAGVFSEWSLVYSPEQVITNANVSLTDDLAWNVYANIPDGCTDSKVTFSINGNEDVAEYSNGRYTLKDILPQQIGFDITATWTGTVNGATITDTVTSSIEDYCRAIIADDAQTDWHELTKALLHYGAAAQVRTGYTGALCNDGIAAVTNPVDLTALDPTLANNDTTVWSGATLRLDDSLALKITLEAPAGVTSVTATVEGRDGSTTLDIIDGCVVLPLNAYELSKTVTFSYGNAEKDLVISADYVLKNTTNAAYTDLAQAVADYSREAEIIKNQ